MGETEFENFELEVVANSETGELYVVNDIYKLVDTILDQHKVFIITDDAGKKKLKSWKASFNKIVKAIDRRRIDTIADYTTSFTNECNALKHRFESRVGEFEEELKRYEDTQRETIVEQEKARKYVATVKFYDEKIIKKLTDFCTKNGCELVIK